MLDKKVITTLRSRRGMVKALKYMLYLIRTKQVNLRKIRGVLFIKNPTYDVFGNFNGSALKKTETALPRGDFAVILPIFNGFSHVRDLLEDLKDCEPLARFIVINDKSTDIRINPLIQDFCQSALCGEIIVIENEVNLGFTHSVNVGLRNLKSDEHVIILNSDTRVPKLFGSKIIQGFDKQNKIASITPLTNAGTICSIPTISDGFSAFEKNYCALQSQVAEETWLSQSGGEWPVIPTGVGFCMAMNSEAIKKVGLFNEKDFAGGYGEENEWCLRAIKVGFKNLICPIVFVQHVGGASFGANKENLISRNLAKLERNDPFYFTEVNRFIASDPLQDFRLEIFLKAISLNSSTERVLVIDHQKGGGATNIQNREFISNPETFFFVITGFDSKNVTVKLVWAGNEFTFSDQTQHLMKVLLNLNFSRVVLNSLALVAGDTLEFLRFIDHYTSEAQLPMIFRLHDYHSICPSLNLIANDGSFCELPPIDSCKRCIPRNPFMEFDFKSDITDWREIWSKILDRCNEIECYSNESVERFLKIHQLSRDKFKVLHHNPFDKREALSVKLEKRIRRPIRIMTVGNINIPKGLNVVLDLAKYLETEGKADTIFHLGGFAPYSGKYSRLIQLGVYHDDFTFDKKVNEISPDLFLFPSIWPETYSLVMDELLPFNTPKLAFTVGAPYERLLGVPGYFFVDYQDPKHLHLEIIRLTRG